MHSNSSKCYKNEEINLSDQSLVPLPLVHAVNFLVEVKMNMYGSINKNWGNTSAGAKGYGGISRIINVTRKKNSWYIMWALTYSVMMLATFRSHSGPPGRILENQFFFCFKIQWFLLAKTVWHENLEKWWFLLIYIQNNRILVLGCKNVEIGKRKKNMLSAGWMQIHNVRKKKCF